MPSVFDSTPKRNFKLMLRWRWQWKSSPLLTVSLLHLWLLWIFQTQTISYVDRGNTFLAWMKYPTEYFYWYEKVWFLQQGETSLFKKWYDSITKIDSILYHVHTTQYADPVTSLPTPSLEETYLQRPAKVKKSGVVSDISTIFLLGNVFRYRHNWEDISVFFHLGWVWPLYMAPQSAVNWLDCPLLLNKW